MDLGVLFSFVFALWRFWIFCLWDGFGFVVLLCICVDFVWWFVFMSLFGLLFYCAVDFNSIVI